MELNTVNNSRTSPTLLDSVKSFHPLHLTALSTIHLRCVLKRFTDLTRHDISVLMTLYYYGLPCSFVYLYSISGGCDITTFNIVLKRSIKKGYVIREQRGRNVCYSITQDGIALLARVNMVLEQSIKEYLDKNP